MFIGLGIRLIFPSAETLTHLDHALRKENESFHYTSFCCVNTQRGVMNRDSCLGGRELNSWLQIQRGQYSTLI